MKNMNNKFDLERFKAGEPAIHEGDDIYYVGTLPNGQIVISWKYGERWDVQNWDLSEFENTTMKPREEWAVVHPTSIHKSYDAAEQDRRNFYSTPDSYITVKIVRP